jgi:deoxyribodipyrimidine photo-lyase
MKSALWWIRRDLRLTDNEALNAAISSCGQVLPVFIVDRALLASPYVGSKRLAFLFSGLRQLDADLRLRGSHVIVREGEPEEQLTALMKESEASAIFAEEDFSPYAHRRDSRIARLLPLRLVNGLTIHPPGTVLKEDGSPYMVFTPFSRKWKALTSLPTDGITPAPAQIATPNGMRVQPIPSEPAPPPGVDIQAGEEEAQRRLAAFVDGEDPAIFRYAETRNRLDLDGTSQLSPYLRFGMLSARQAAVTALAALEAAPDEAAGKGAETWLNELIWREFYVNILHHFPYVRGESFRTDLRDIPWDNDEAAFAAWRDGRTGYPVVDAAMRQLTYSGWMHNRARMIVASFLVKDLLIDWRWGERWFMRHLVDGDPAANNGGWQWTAGTGTDAAPYFRVFNPILQGRKFDPDGAFIRRWVPELSDVPDEFVHQPWQMPSEVQRSSDCIIGQDYPRPIVAHKHMREQALALYRQTLITAGLAEADRPAKVEPASIALDDVSIFKPCREGAN